MTLDKASRRNDRLRLLLAFALNAAFLIIMLTCFAPAYETNDDLLMSKFVDGQMAHKTAHVPFINITLGLLLKTLYSLFGSSVNWWSVCEYGAVLLGFTAVTWVLLRKLELFPALTMTAVFLLTFGVDTYLSMNFSKASGVATVGGLTLMLYAVKNERGRVLRVPLLLGLLLSLYGFFWRYEEFFACAAIMAGLGLYCLIETAEAEKAQATRLKLRATLRLILPFVLLLALVLAFFGLNRAAWTTDEYDYFYHFNKTRNVLIDYVVPSYDEMPEVYDSLDMDQTSIDLFNDWAFYDTEKFTTDSMQAVIDARADFVHHPSIGECLGIFLDKCLRYFVLERPIAGLFFTLALFLACGRRRARDWLAAFWFAGAFAAMYFYFIYLGRYPSNRVELGLFFAMSVGLVWLIEPGRLKSERILCAVVLLLSLFVGYRSCRNVCLLDAHSTVEDKSFEKAAVERIISDDEHLYFVKYLSVDHMLYAPFETPPAGYADKIVFIGGWSCRHPEIERVLASYGITNPYRDIIGSEHIYIIDCDIEKTMAYINKYYDPDAEAELVEPLSSDTMLKIYRILD